MIPDPHAQGDILDELRQSYDIVGKAAQPASRADLRLMLQSLLRDRFHLTLRRETRRSPAYRLIAAKGGAKLERAEDPGDLVMHNGPDGYVFRNAEVLRLAGLLSSFLNAVVVDETRLAGLYNFTIKIPDDLRQSSAVKTVAGTVDAPAASRFAGALKPLGLELTAGTADVEYLVIEHVEHPSGN